MSGNNGWGDFFTCRRENRATPTEKETDRKRIAADVEKFLKQKGKIKRV